MVRSSCLFLGSFYTRKATAVLLVLVITVDTIDMRPSILSKITSTVFGAKSGFKWFSVKMCGKLGDPCKLKSRKHCCAVGLTCVPSIKMRYKKIRLSRFGNCEPVPTLAMHDMEFQERDPEAANNDSGGL